MKHGLICQLDERNGETVLVLHDAAKTGASFQGATLFTELPEPIEIAIHNKELMAQLAENILIRLAILNGIEI
ncbi:hypothetical protein Q9L42_005375 [Methylomarinum sp. Ch1-1]|uniref:Uncharacterized protein n=1 Tax=Methylomarinum roseum TaxID=3067653 RepID=A0AAU7NXA9_9GAMM|nr:hypothetical protein [Methylomarinum sp. Ch1-1]MDP4522369.1 hypothetical protein [Methylomarinum sp. Ch1-1]